MKAMPLPEPGGRLVIDAIRKESCDREVLAEIGPQRDLWLEEIIQSVSNLSRADIWQFLSLAAEIHLRPTLEAFLPAEAKRALQELKEGKIRGAKVLRLRPEGQIDMMKMICFMSWR